MCRRGRSRWRGSLQPARTGTVARSARIVGEPDPGPRPSRLSTRWRRPRRGRGRPARAGCVYTPSGDSLGPSAAPGPAAPGRSAWRSARVGPVVGDELGVPAQQGSGRHQPHLAQRDRQQPAQCAEHGAVEPGQRWSEVGAAEHGDLVTQHKDFDVLGGVGAGEQRQPAQHASEDQVGESERHNQRSCWAGPDPGWSGPPAGKALIRDGDTVLGTHRASSARIAS